MREQAGAFDDVDAGVGERGNHRLGAIDGEERVAVAPNEFHRNVELAVDRWEASLMDGTPAQQKAQAEGAIAIIEGLILLRLLAGPKTANRAAKTIGIA